MLDLKRDTARANSNSGNSSINSTLSRARAMLNTSISRGNFSRLNRRERLRSSTDRDQGSSTKKKKENNEFKIFEFVLVDVEDCEDWAISNDIVVLRGLAEISTVSKESDIRKEIGNAVQRQISKCQ